MVCCVFKATNLVNNYRPRKSARTFASKQKVSNKLYTVLPVGFIQVTIQILKYLSFIFFKIQHLLTFSYFGFKPLLI